MISSNKLFSGSTGNEVTCVLLKLRNWKYLIRPNLGIPHFVARSVKFPKDPPIVKVTKEDKAHLLPVCKGFVYA